MIRSREISFVIQGPVDKAVTPTSLAALRANFPHSELVLSTWEGSDTTGLDYDTLVLSQDPGAVQAMAPGFPETFYNNGNRQIVSTRAGLKAASRRYTAKVRSDLILQGRKWLEHWNRYPQRCSEWKMFEQRIIIGNFYARNPRRDVPKPFHPSDWIMFGLRDDLLLLWDVDLEQEPESSHWFRHRPKPRQIPFLADTRRYYAEQYLWKTLLSKFGPVQFDHLCDATEENVRLTQLTFANNLIILDSAQFPYRIPKHGQPRRTWRFACYSHREWIRMYQEHCERRALSAHLSRLADLDHWITGLYCLIPQPIRHGAWKVSSLRKQLSGSLIAD